MKASRIAETFDVSLFDANLALLIIRGRIDVTKHPKRFPLTASWLRACYHSPRKPEIKLEALNELLGGCGVECIEVDGRHVDSYYMNTVASYINLGETYAVTLLLDHEPCRWSLTSWADFYESVAPLSTCD